MELSKADLAVFDTNEVLLEHLLAKLKCLCTSEDLCQAVLSEITRSFTNEDLVNLLKNDENLTCAISNSQMYIHEKEDIGEKIYAKVVECEPDLAEKLTGMILDLDLVTLQSITKSDALLKQAVEKCKSTYHSYQQEAEYKEKLGERVYNIACSSYNQDVASILTGMLLELDTFQLEKLIINACDLENKLKLCYETYRNHYN